MSWFGFELVGHPVSTAVGHHGGVSGARDRKADRLWTTTAKVAAAGWLGAVAGVCAVVSLDVVNTPSHVVTPWMWRVIALTAACVAIGVVALREWLVEQFGLGPVDLFHVFLEGRRLRRRA